MGQGKGCVGDGGVEGEIVGAGGKGDGGDDGDGAGGALEAVDGFVGGFFGGPGGQELFGGVEVG